MENHNIFYLLPNFSGGVKRLLDLTSSNLSVKCRFKLSEYFLLTFQSDFILVETSCSEVGFDTLAIVGDSPVDKHLSRGWHYVNFGFPFLFSLHSRIIELERGGVFVNSGILMIQNKFTGENLGFSLVKKFTCNIYIIDKINKYINK